MKTLYSVLALSLVTLSAAADWDRTPVPTPYNPPNSNYDGQWISCQVSIGNQQYEDGGYGLAAARDGAIASCSVYRNAGECRSRVQCSVPMLDWTVCTTTIGNSTYSNGAITLDQALHGAVNSCTIYRNAGDCRFNAECKAPMSDTWFKPWTSCQTVVGNQSYRDADMNPQMALQNTVNNCSIYRNAGQCRAHVVCSSPVNFIPAPPVFTPAPDPRRAPRRDNRRAPIGGGVIDATPEVSLNDPRARVHCETYSGQTRVIGRGMSSGVVNSRVTEVCKMAYGTYPRECDQNVACNVR